MTADRGRGIGRESTELGMAGREVPVDVGIGAGTIDGGMPSTPDPNGFSVNGMDKMVSRIETRGFRETGSAGRETPVLSVPGATSERLVGGLRMVFRSGTNPSLPAICIVGAIVVGAGTAPMGKVDICPRGAAIAAAVVVCGLSKEDRVLGIESPGMLNRLRLEGAAFADNVGRSRWTARSVFVLVSTMTIPLSASSGDAIRVAMVRYTRQKRTI